MGVSSNKLAYWAPNAFEIIYEKYLNSQRYQRFRLPGQRLFDDEERATPTGKIEMYRNMHDAF